MQGIVFVEMLDSKVVDAQDKGGLSCFVAPEARCERHWLVTMRCQFFDKLVESKDASFLEALHSFSNFEIDETVVGNLDVIAGIVPNLLGMHQVWTLVCWWWSMQLLMLRPRWGAPLWALEMVHGDGWGAWIAGVFELVSTCCHADSARLGFLLSDAAGAVCVGDFAILWDLRFVDEKESASSLDAL